VREVDVEEDDVGIELLDQRDRVGDRSRLADDLDGRLEPGAHAGAKEVVILHEDDAAQRPHDSLSSTSVPAPGAETMRAVPPTRSILPRIDSATPRRSGATASGSKPAPRSRT